MYKLIEIYDAGGDVSKEWFVKYHFLKPDEMQVPGESSWQRFKVSTGVNITNLKTERRKQLRIVKKGITLLLKSGFNPFYEFNLCTNITYSGYTAVNCIDKYLKEIKPNVKESTHDKYTSNLSLLKTWLIEKKMEMKMIYDFGKADVSAFMKHYQAKKEWANKTYNHYLNSIHAFFQYFIDNYDDYLDKNPCNNMKRLQPMKKGNRPFDNYEFKITLEYFRENNRILYDFCRFVYYSCMRPDAEARLIRICDIDMVSRRIRIGNEITKGKATQVIPIDNEFYNFLEELQLQRYPRDFYIFGRGGKPATVPVADKYFSRLFRPIKELLMLHKDVSLYAFKHTRAIHMVEDGETLYNIIRFTRHRTLATLMDYLKDMGVVIGETNNFKSRRI